MSPSRDSYPSIPELPAPSGLEDVPDRTILILLYEQVMKLSIAWREHTEEDTRRWHELDVLVDEKKRRESDARALRREAQKQVVSRGVAGLVSILLLAVGYLVHAAMAGKLGP